MSGDRDRIVFNLLRNGAVVKPKQRFNGWDFQVFYLPEPGAKYFLSDRDILVGSSIRNANSIKGSIIYRELSH